MVRFDQPGREAEAEAGDPGREARSEAPGLIASLFQALRVEAPDRRRGRRHEAAGRDVWVGWWSGDEFRAVPGKVRDIGRGGAKVVVDTRPPRRRSVWLYMDMGDHDGPGCARGEVVGHTPVPAGRFAVRLRFAAPCPTALLQAVVCAPPEG
jgi:hypothetical protein